MNTSVEYRLMQASVDVENIIDEERKELVFSAMAKYNEKAKMDKETAEQEFLDEVLHIERESMEQKERFMNMFNKAVFHKAVKQEKN